MKSFPSVFESINDLTIDHLNGLLELSKKFKGYAEDWQGLPVPFLKNPIIATSFLENSTRTKHSFAIAIKKLGATYIDFNADTSSLKKGETLEETLLTLKSQGIDLCVIRTSVSNELSQFKENPPIKIINGGDGVNQHPTQALLDLFTMKEISNNNLEGKTITILGDIVHSRVGHSLIDLLPQFGIKVILCGPKEYLPGQDELKNYSNVVTSTNRDQSIEKSDYLYLLRIQKERHGSQYAHIYEDYHNQYGVNVDLLNKLGKRIPILHPGPANVGVEISKDLMDSDLYCGYEQVRNSIYMRMAIIQAVLQNNDKNVGKKIEKFDFTITQ